VSKTYKSYLFRTKDPVIDELRTLIEDSVGSRVKGKHLVKIERDGGPSASAMRGWFFGKVRRPQSAGVEATGRALGYKRVWERMK
jgi:hypothetical protein